MKRVPHPVISTRSVIRIEEENGVSPQALVLFARQHDAVDGEEEKALVWVQYGTESPTSYWVRYLLRNGVLGAMLYPYHGLCLPEDVAKEEVCL
jgi:hypothetical protein